MNHPSESEPKPQTDWWALSACILAISLMIFPVEADLPFALFGGQRQPAALGFTALCFLVVATPFVISLLRRRKQPHVWGNRGDLIATAIILSLNVISIVCIFVRQTALH